jgi:hypothetical protein
VGRHASFLPLQLQAGVKEVVARSEQGCLRVWVRAKRRPFEILSEAGSPADPLPDTAGDSHGSRDRGCLVGRPSSPTPHPRRGVARGVLDPRGAGKQHREQTAALSGGLQEHA